MDNVLVLFKTEADFRKSLTGIFDGCNVIFREGNDTSSIDAETAENTAVIFGNPKADFLTRCPRLKWLQLQSAGTNGYVSGEVKESVLLTCASGCYGHAVSEHMVGLTITLIKKLHLYRDEQAAGRWTDRGTVKSIEGAVVLVIGLGDIGSHYARRMKALGSYVIGVRRSAHAKPAWLDEQIAAPQMEDALGRADVVAVILPGTRDTAGLIGRSQMEKMKRDAVIVNCGRGSVIDTDALCAALESGAIGGAGLDVTSPEPLPPGHRLWKMENAVITPHVSGGFHMPQTFHYIMKLNLENARRFVKGEALASRVNYKTGFRYAEDEKP